MVKDLSGLPTARDEGTGERPHPEARAFLTPLAEQWYQEYLDAGSDDRAFAVPGTRFRASWAGGCARSLAYKVLHNDAKVALADLQKPSAAAEWPDEAGIAAAADAVEQWKPTNPPSLADLWRMSLGSKVHELFDHAIKAKFPTAEVEQPIDLRPNVDGSASSDVLIRMPLGDMPVDLVALIFGVEAMDMPEDRIVTILLELKTSGGYAYKLSVIPFKGPAQGPKLGHKLQVGLAAKAVGADAVIVGYLSMENISHDVAKRHNLADVERFLAGWVYPMSELLPLVEREERRVNRVLALLDEGKLAPRMIFDGEVPAKAEVQNVDNGFWTVVNDAGEIEASDTTWWCGYCWHRDRCRTDGPGTVAVEIRVGADG